MSQIIDGSILTGAADSPAPIEQPSEAVVLPPATAETPETSPDSSAESTATQARDGDELTENAFAAFGLRHELLDGLEAIGFKEPSPIQKAAIPELMLGRDLVGQAQTGTGKTAAFGLPLLHGLDLDQRTPQVLVLTPTRELAIQVADAITSYASRMKRVRVLADLRRFRFPRPDPAAPPRRAHRGGHPGPGDGPHASGHSGSVRAAQPGAG